jgi:hypothetical protein
MQTAIAGDNLGSRKGDRQKILKFIRGKKSNIMDSMAVIMR